MPLAPPLVLRPRLRPPYVSPLTVSATPSVAATPCCPTCTRCSGTQTPPASHSYGPCGSTSQRIKVGAWVGAWVGRNMPENRLLSNKQVQYCRSCKAGWLTNRQFQHYHDWYCNSGCVRGWRGGVCVRWIRVVGWGEGRRVGEGGRRIRVGGGRWEVGGAIKVSGWGRVVRGLGK